MLPQKNHISGKTPISNDWIIRFGLKSEKLFLYSLRWRHNDHDSVSNHQPHGCLLNRLFRRRSKKTLKLRVTGLCVGNSPGPVNSPHKGPVTRKCFHLMTSSCYVWTEVRKTLSVLTVCEGNLQGPKMQLCFDVLFVVNMNNHSISRWFERPWRPRDVPVMNW